MLALSLLHPRSSQVNIQAVQSGSCMVETATKWFPLLAVLRKVPQIYVHWELSRALHPPLTTCCYQMWLFHDVILSVCLFKCSLSPPPVLGVCTLLCPQKHFHIYGQSKLETSQFIQTIYSHFRVFIAAVYNTKFKGNLTASSYRRGHDVSYVWWEQFKLLSGEKDEACSPPA